MEGTLIECLAERDNCAEQLFESNQQLKLAQKQLEVGDIVYPVMAVLYFGHRH